MSKKMKALQISALLTAVSGAALLVPASSSTANAAEVRTIDERCWDQTPAERRLHNCEFIQYGLKPGSDANGESTPQDNAGPTPPDGGSGGPDGGGTDPDPVDPYTS